MIVMIEVLIRAFRGRDGLDTDPDIFGHDTVGVNLDTGNASKVPFGQRAAERRPQSNR